MSPLPVLLFMNKTLSIEDANKLTEDASDLDKVVLSLEGTGIKYLCENRLVLMYACTVHS